jgi:hypothetical protein
MWTSVYRCLEGSHTVSDGGFTLPFTAVLSSSLVRRQNIDADAPDLAQYFEDGPDTQHQQTRPGRMTRKDVGSVSRKASDPGAIQSVGAPAILEAFATNRDGTVHRVFDVTTLQSVEKHLTGGRAATDAQSPTAPVTLPDWKLNTDGDVRTTALFVKRVDGRHYASGNAEPGLATFYLNVNQSRGLLITGAPVHSPMLERAEYLLRDAATSVSAPPRLLAAMAHAEEAGQANPEALGRRRRLQKEAAAARARALSGADPLPSNAMYQPEDLKRAAEAQQLLHKPFTSKRGLRRLREFLAGPGADGSARRSTSVRRAVAKAPDARSDASAEASDDGEDLELKQARIRKAQEAAEQRRRDRRQAAAGLEEPVGVIQAFQFSGAAAEMPFLRDRPGTSSSVDSSNPAAAVAPSHTVFQAQLWDTAAGAGITIADAPPSMPKPRPSEGAHDPLSPNGEAPATASAVDDDELYRLRCLLESSLQLRLGSGGETTVNGAMFVPLHEHPMLPPDVAQSFGALASLGRSTAPASGGDGSQVQGVDHEQRQLFSTWSKFQAGVSVLALAGAPHGSCGTDGRPASSVSLQFAQGSGLGTQQIGPATRFSAAVFRFADAGTGVAVYWVVRARSNKCKQQDEVARAGPASGGTAQVYAYQRFATFDGPRTLSVATSFTLFTAVRILRAARFIVARIAAANYCGVQRCTFMFKQSADVAWCGSGSSESKLRLRSRSFKKGSDGIVDVRAGNADLYPPPPPLVFIMAQHIHLFSWTVTSPSLALPPPFRAPESYRDTPGWEPRRPGENHFDDDLLVQAHIPPSAKPANSDRGRAAVAKPLPALLHSWEVARAAAVESRRNRTRAPTSANANAGQIDLGVAAQSVASAFPGRLPTHVDHAGKFQYRVENDQRRRQKLIGRVLQQERDDEAGKTRASGFTTVAGHTTVGGTLVPLVHSPGAARSPSKPGDSPSPATNRDHLPTSIALALKRQRMNTNPQTQLHLFQQLLETVRGNKPLTPFVADYFHLTAYERRALHLHPAALAGVEDDPFIQELMTEAKTSRSPARRRPEWRVDSVPAAPRRPVSELREPRATPSRMLGLTAGPAMPSRSASVQPVRAPLPAKVSSHKPLSCGGGPDVPVSGSTSLVVSKTSKRHAFGLEDSNGAANGADSSALVSPSIPRSRVRLARIDSEPLVGTDAGDHVNHDEDAIDDVLAAARALAADEEFFTTASRLTREGSAGRAGSAGASRRHAVMARLAAMAPRFLFEEDVEVDESAGYDIELNAGASELLAGTVTGDEGALMSQLPGSDVESPSRGMTAAALRARGRRVSYWLRVFDLAVAKRSARQELDDKSRSAPFDSPPPTGSSVVEPRREREFASPLGQDFLEAALIRGGDEARGDVTPVAPAELFDEHALLGSGAPFEFLCDCDILETPPSLRWFAPLRLMPLPRGVSERREAAATVASLQHNVVAASEWLGNLSYRLKALALLQRGTVAVDVGSADKGDEASAARRGSRNMEPSGLPIVVFSIPADIAAAPGPIGRRLLQFLDGAVAQGWFVPVTGDSDRSGLATAAVVSALMARAQEARDTARVSALARLKASHRPSAAEAPALYHLDDASLESHMDVLWEAVDGTATDNMLDRRGSIASAEVDAALSVSALLGRTATYKLQRVPAAAEWSLRVREFELWTLRASYIERLEALAEAYAEE